ncbi:MAG: RidA/YER057c/UK114 superfamily, group 2, YoaB-like protein, partial [uncultured Acetobacteraceae bacterium]
DPGFGRGATLAGRDRPWRPGLACRRGRRRRQPRHGRPDRRRPPAGGRAAGAGRDGQAPPAFRDGGAGRRPGRPGDEPLLERLVRSGDQACAHDDRGGARGPVLAGGGHRGGGAGRARGAERL